MDSSGLSFCLFLQVTSILPRRKKFQLWKRKWCWMQELQLERPHCRRPPFSLVAMVRVAKTTRLDLRRPRRRQPQKLEKDASERLFFRAIHVADQFAHHNFPKSIKLLPPNPMLLYLFDALFVNKTIIFLAIFGIWMQTMIPIIFYLIIQTHLNTYAQYMRPVQQKRKTKYAQL